MDRRTFMLATAAFVAGCSQREGAGAGPAAKAWPLGVQLYSVRELMAGDVAATLDLVASVGFEEVEFAGYYDHTAAETRRLLDAAGLAAPATHVSKDLLADDAPRMIDFCAEVGHRYVVVPWLPEDQRTPDDFRRHAEDFNRLGEACKSVGLEFAYHNHDWEFDTTDGQVHYDILLAETDPELVKLELDLAWAKAGNADPVAYFEAWPGRFPMCHLKDLADGKEADIGTGVVDFDRILAHAATAGLQHGFVERDHPADAAAALRANHDAMRPLWTKYMGKAAA